MDNAQLETITVGDAETALDLIEKAFFDIPFDNSAFQTEAFVIAAQITPERAYRSIGLQMHSRLEAIRENLYQMELSDIEIEELQEKIDNPETNKFDRRRAELKIRQIQSGRPWANKLLNDALVEVNLLYKHFQALPRFTREQFEAGERAHFEQRLTRQVAGLAGAPESLINMRADLQALTSLEAALEGLPKSSQLTYDSVKALVSKSSNFIPPANVTVEISNSKG